MNLTPDQHTAIDRHLRKENWLLNEDVIAELTDHYINGISERMAYGMTFDEALREVHTGFGGRKELLKIEEDYQKTQAKSNGRLVRRLFVRYFQRPRLSITLTLFAGVYGFIRLVPSIGSVLLSDKGWLFYPALGGLVVLYVLSLAQLIERTEQTTIAKSTSQTIQMLVQGFTSVLIIGFFVNTVVPINRLLGNYPLPVAALITLALIVETAVTELVFDHLYKNRKPKTA